jgi:hypothetical protein
MPDLLRLRASRSNSVPCWVVRKTRISVATSEPAHSGRVYTGSGNPDLPEKKSLLLPSSTFVSMSPLHCYGPTR